MSLNTKRFEAIDILRGIAAFSVLVFHAREYLWVGLSAWMHHPAMHWARPDALIGVASYPFRFGYWGVALFFVISGYCIHRSGAALAGRAKSRLPILAFYWKRIRRIGPVLAAVLILTFLIDSLSAWLAPGNMKLGDLSVKTFVGNLLGLQTAIVPAYGSDGPLWSLGIEIQLYALYPLLFLFLQRFGVWLAVITTGVISVTTCCFFGAPVENTFAGYYFCWVIGVLVAEHEIRQCYFPTKFFLLATPVLLALPVASDFHLMALSMPVTTNLLAIPFALTLLLAIRQPKHFEKWGRVGRLFVWMGLFSYSLYMIHAPVLTLLKSWLFAGGQSEHFWPVLPAVCTCVVAGWLLFLGVERYSLVTRPREKSANKPAVKSCAGGSN